MPKYQDIILVHTMGKVGSTSVYQSLKESTADDRFVAHTHLLNIPTLLRRLRSGRDRNPDLLRHLTKAFEIQRVIREHPDARITWISLTREPVSRELSNLIENPWILGLPSEADRTGAALKTALDWLSREATYNYTLSWFQREFIPATRRDIFRHPFDSDQGYLTLPHPRRNEQLLLIQMEQLDRLTPAVWDQLIGYPVHLNRHNTLSSKSPAAQQFSAQLKAAFRLPAPLAQHLYSSPLVRHFYSTRQIQQFQARWSGSR